MEPRRTLGSARSPGNSHLVGVFKHAGCGGRSWQLSGCGCGHSGGSQDEHPARQGRPPTPTPQGLEAGGGVLGAPFARRPLPRTRAGSRVGGEAVSLRRAGLRRCHALGSSSQCALWESEVVGWTAGQRGPDTCRWDGRLPGCDALCRAPVPGCAGPPPGAEPPAVEASNPNQNTAARPASEAHAPRGFRWERGRPVPPRSASPDSLGQLLSLLVACRLAQEKPTRVPGARRSPLGQARGPRAAVTPGPDGKHQENSPAPRAGDGSSRRPY